MTTAINIETVKSFRLVLLLIGLLVSIAVVAAVVISRSIVRPLIQAVGVAQTVASGDLTTIFKPAPADEIGDLMRSLQAMNVALSAVISQVQAGTNTIAVASSQIATGNLDLSARTESQAGTLEETAASMEELTATVRKNKENAREAKRLAADASEVATKRRRYGRSSCRGNGQDRQRLEKNRQYYRCHRWHRVSDKYPRAERFG